MNQLRIHARAGRVIPDDLRRLQVEASDPAVSAWVAANAGSGKTHVLAQRVIRLLLENSLYHLYQGRRRQHGKPSVRRAAPLDRA